MLWATMNGLRSFPLIRELRKLLDASDWGWQKPSAAEVTGPGMDPDWWIGLTAKGETGWLR